MTMTYTLSYYNASGSCVYREECDALSLADVKRHAYEVVCGLRSSYDIRQVTIYDGESTDSFNI